MNKTDTKVIKVTWLLTLSLELTTGKLHLPCLLFVNNNDIPFDLPVE